MSILSLQQVNRGALSTKTTFFDCATKMGL